MLSREPTPDELRATLEDLLSNTGRAMPSDTGLDDETLDAVRRVWAAGPNPSPRLLDAARAELDAQLDGTHEQEQEARIIAMIDAGRSQGS